MHSDSDSDDAPLRRFVANLVSRKTSPVEDAPKQSPAHSEVKFAGDTCWFVYMRNGGDKMRVQTTARAANDSRENAARICRLLWLKADAGWSREDILKHRIDLYSRCFPTPSSSSTDIPVATVVVKEEREDSSAHGSCGMGVAAASVDSTSKRRRSESAVPTPPRAKAKGKDAKKAKKAKQTEKVEESAKEKSKPEKVKSNASAVSKANAKAKAKAKTKAKAKAKARASAERSDDASAVAKGRAGNKDDDARKRWSALSPVEARVKFETLCSDPETSTEACETKWEEKQAKRKSSKLGASAADPEVAPRKAQPQCANAVEDGAFESASRQAIAEAKCSVVHPTDSRVAIACRADGKARGKRRKVNLAAVFDRALQPAASSSAALGPPVEPPVPQQDGVPEAMQDHNWDVFKEAAAAPQASKPNRKTDSRHRAADPAALRQAKADTIGKFASYLLKGSDHSNLGRPLQTIPATFRDSTHYYETFADAILAESREQLRATAPAGSRKIVPVCGPYAIGPSLGEGIATFFVEMASPIKHGMRSIGRGSVLQLHLQKPPCRVLVLCLRRYDNTKYHICLAEEYLPQSVDAVKGFSTTDQDLRAYMRAWSICGKAANSDLLNEMLGHPLEPSTAQDPVETRDQDHRHDEWKVVAAYPINVRSRPEDGEDAELKPRKRLQGGQRFQVQRVLPVPKFFGVDSSGLKIPKDSPESTRNWLQLADGTGWVYDSKLVHDRKQLLCEQVADDLTPNDLSIAFIQARAKSELSVLNQLQRAAVHSFLLAKQKLCLLQGPPGTGKSNTLLKLIACLIALGRPSSSRGTGPFIMVCAPTNKAVQHLCEKVCAAVDSAAAGSALAGAKLALSGVDDRLPDLPAKVEGPTALRDIYADDIVRAVKARIAGCSDDAQAVANYVEMLIKRAPRTRSTRLQSLIEELRACKDQDACTTLVQEVAGILDKQAESSLVIGRQFIETADVLFCTLATAGREELHQLGRPEWCVVDEAAAAIESETLLLVPWQPRGGRMLLVGDPQQLEASVVSERGKACRFGRSLMGRLFEAGREHITLEEQYRMHPAIMDFPNREYYGGKLRCGGCMADLTLGNSPTATDWLNTFRGAGEVAKALAEMPPYLVINVNGFEMRSGEGNSLSNPCERDLAFEITDALTKHGGHSAQPPCLLTFYTQQVQVLKRVLDARRAEAKRKGTILRREPEVHTTDSFQGSEAETVILMCVRNKDLGFLKEFRRLNVALTRAKRRLIVLANVDALESVCSKLGTNLGSGVHFKAFLADARQRQLVVGKDDVVRILNNTRCVAPSSWQGRGHDQQGRPASSGHRQQEHSQSSSHQAASHRATSHHTPAPSSHDQTRSAQWTVSRPVAYGDGGANSSSGPTVYGWSPNLARNSNEYRPPHTGAWQQRQSAIHGGAGWYQQQRQSATHGVAGWHQVGQQGTWKQPWATWRESDRQWDSTAMPRGGGQRASHHPVPSSRISLSRGDRRGRSRSRGGRRGRSRSRGDRRGRSRSRGDRRGHSRGDHSRHSRADRRTHSDGTWR